MELKKTKKASLEDKRNTFFLIGLVISLGTILLAFEWPNKPSKSESLGNLQLQTIEEEIIPITREQEIKPPPPPQQVIEVINIVDNNVEIDDDLEIEDTEADNETIIDVQPVIETTEEKEVEEDKIFIIVENPPEFPGGEKSLYAYISNAVRYPVIAQENGIQGKVYVKFVVNEQGKVSDCQIIRGIDSSLDNEALRVINSLPRFKPGKQRGRPVKVFYNAVINFTLQN